MARRDYLLLGFISVLVFAVLGALIATPGYLDADTYYYGGTRLVRGFGFTEEILWNYLDNPGPLPHPSHGYWAPLASMLAAAGMGLAGQVGFRQAQIGFVILGSLIGPAIAALAAALGMQRRQVWLAGGLGVLCGFFAAYVTTIDNYGVLMVCGAVILAMLAQRESMQAGWLVLGLALALAIMSLARTDSLLWVGLVFVGLLLPATQGDHQAQPLARRMWLAGSVLLLWLLLVSPWYWRNLQTFGSPFGAGGKALFLTSYEDIFAWPAARVTAGAWLEQGWGAIATASLGAAFTSLQNWLLAQVGIGNLVFVLLGLPRGSKQPVVRLALFGWFILWGALAVFFPYTSNRGSFFHASAAFWPLIPILVVWGVDRLQSKIPRSFVESFLILSALGITSYAAYTAIFTRDWNGDVVVYQQAEEALQQAGIDPGEVVLAANPALYANTNERPALIIPAEPPESIANLATWYHARFVIFDERHCRQANVGLCTGEASDDKFMPIGIFGPLHAYRIGDGHH